MAKKGKPMTTEAHKSFLASVPPEHQAHVTEAFNEAPAEQRGPFIDFISFLRSKNIPWDKIKTILPLLLAFFASPSTQWLPLLLAVAALLQPVA